FYTEKIGDRWWLCTPAGHGFFKQSLNLVNPPTNMAAKYGSEQIWANAAITRFLSWGFNTVDGYSSNYVWPVNVWGRIAATYVPFIQVYSPAAGAMGMGVGSEYYDSSQSKWMYNHYPGAHAVKNIWGDMPPAFYATSVWAPEIADFYDPAIASNMAYNFKYDYTWQRIASSPESSYLLGVEVGDADYLFAFGPGDVNGGTGVEQLAWDVLAASPIATAGRASDVYSTQAWSGGGAEQFLYYDNQLKSKAQLQIFLQNRYASSPPACAGASTGIAALNACWGSSYTTFGSSGTDVSGEVIGPPNGGTGYTHTLAHTPDMYSVGIYVNGALVAGNLAHDAGGGTADPTNAVDGRLWGPFVSGTVTYGTSALSLTFSTTTSTSAAIARILTDGSTVTVDTLWQHGLWPGAHITITGTTNYNGSYTVNTVNTSEEFTVLKSGSFPEEDNTGTFSLASLPSTGDTLTVNYRYGGWRNGTGLMDEANNHSWSDTDQSTTVTSGLKPQMQTDLNDFLEQIAAKFFSDCKTAVNNYMPGLLYLGPIGMPTHGTPSRAPVLKAAGQYIDVLTTAYGPVFTQADLDYIYQNYGDKPIFDTYYGTANADSPYSGTADQDTSTAFATHTAEGADYLSRLNTILKDTYAANGSHPYVGITVWGYSDGTADPQNQAWGRVTVLDNAYDGHEDVTDTAACSTPLSSYTCGGEAGHYTDLISGTKAGNQLWLVLAAK
ncbi:MAG: hypothetical protein ACREBW_07505, partial [Candidatus Micrarchaeaceae archaeon]